MSLADLHRNMRITAYALTLPSRRDALRRSTSSSPAAIRLGLSRLRECEPQAEGAVLPLLTPRERDVLALLADGADNPTIGETISITSESGHNYVSQVLKKLEVADRAAAVNKAQQAGLGGKRKAG